MHGVGNCSYKQKQEMIEIKVRLERDILMMYPNTKTEVSRFRLSKVRPRTGQTDKPRRQMIYRNFFYRHRRGNEQLAILAD